MKAGTLRHRVRFERRTAIQNPETGEMLPDGWAEAFTVWASVEPMSTRDVLAAQEQQSAANHRIIIRYRRDVSTQMRIVHRNQVHEIMGEPLPDKVSGLEYLTIMTATGLSDG